MASFRPLTLNTNGHDALLGSADNLTLENAPQVDTDAANKLYVDTEIDTAETNLTADYEAKIQAEEDARIAADDQLQANIDAEAETRATEDAALQEQINLINGDEPGSENPYVKRTGDDMTGDLTFDTNKIKLLASGQATFVDKVTTGSLRCFDANETARIKSARTTGDLLTIWNGATSVVDGTKVITFSADGGATLTGPLEAASIDGGTY